MDKKRLKQILNDKKIINNFVSIFGYNFIKKYDNQNTLMDYLKFH